MRHLERSENSSFSNKSATDPRFEEVCQENGKNIIRKTRIIMAAAVYKFFLASEHEALNGVKSEWLGSKC